MMLEATVSTVQEGRYRVSAGGDVSAPIPALSGAYRQKIGTDGTVRRIPPALGDAVLCWFPGNALRDGCIVGIWEG